MPWAAPSQRPCPSVKKALHSCARPFCGPISSPLQFGQRKELRYATRRAEEVFVGSTTKPQSSLSSAITDSEQEVDVRQAAVTDEAVGDLPPMLLRHEITTPSVRRTVGECSR